MHITLVMTPLLYFICPPTTLLLLDVCSVKVLWTHCVCAVGNIEDAPWEEDTVPPSHTEVRLCWGDEHVQSMGRNWGMCTLGHLLQICCCPNDHRGGLRLILEEAWGTMCVLGTYFKLKVTSSVQPYVMKTVIALMGSVLIMMNIQYVFSWVHWLRQRAGILWHGAHGWVQYHLLRTGIY